MGMRVRLGLGLVVGSGKRGEAAGDDGGSQRWGVGGCSSPLGQSWATTMAQ